jgi:hypothetical protein
VLNLLITYIVCEPYVVKFLDWTPVRHLCLNNKWQGSKGHQKHIFLDESDLCVQNIDTNLSSIANGNGKTLCDHFKREKRNLYLHLNSDSET